LGLPEHKSAPLPSLSSVARFLPFLGWWPRVNRATLRADASAALIGAIVVLPQGVAFATLAGLPPQYGLY
jgi:SulP family sulfate permease